MSRTKHQAERFATGGTRYTGAKVKARRNGGQAVTQDFFSEVVDRIPFGGLESRDPLTYKVYEPDRLVLGKRMEDHLRIAVCY